MDQDPFDSGATVSAVVFHKLTGSGNDFVMLDGRHTRHQEWPVDRIAAVCDRRNGIGADGLVILDPVAEGKVRMTYWNSDGSPAPMCGNAALCSTRLSAALELADPAGMTLVTGAGEFRTRCVGDGYMAQLNLPDVAVPKPLDIPMVAGESAIMMGIVGVPHVICRVNDIAAVDLPRRGRELRFHEAVGAGGANVNFFGPTSSSSGAGGVATAPSWSLRTYERGIEAETLACGTGTVAAALALAAAGEIELPVDIRTASGMTLTVDATIGEELATNIWLTGPGRRVARGVWFG